MAMDNALVKSFILRRGYDRDFLSRLDAVDGSRMIAGLDRCSALIASAVRTRSEIGVFCDFDTDGISSLLVICSSLAAMGADFVPWFADPSAGYGLRPQDVRAMKEAHPGIRVLLTADVGISADEAVKEAGRLGIMTVVTDHHQKDSPDRPATAWADPSLPEDPYPYTVCGAHVAADLMGRVADDLCVTDGVRRKVRLSRKIAGIGARGDVMPCSGPSRADSRDAVALCKFLLMSEDADLDDGGLWGRVMLGLRTLLLHVTQLEADGSPRRYPKAPQDFSETDIDMVLSPMLNSMRRTGNDLASIRDLVWAGDAEGRAEAAARIAAMNEERKERVAAAMEALVAQDQPMAPLVYVDREGACEGSFVGLVANKLMGESGSPCLVLIERQDGALSGSGRAPGGRDLRSRLVAQSILAQGHGPAFGVSMEPGRLDDAWRVVAAIAEEVEAERDDDPFCAIDVLIAPGDDGISPYVPGSDVLWHVDDLVTACRRMAPFGPGFERPVAAVVFTVDGTERLSLMGSEKEHAKWALSDGTQAILWRGAEQASGVREGQTVAVVGECAVNRFRGRSCAQVSGEVLLLDDDARSLVDAFRSL